MLFYLAKFSVLIAVVNSQITFKDGTVGVNFGGYHASAGLGGLLTGNAAHGGLHAEAGTPFGQSARAGLGGQVGDDGTSTGGLYAGATAGRGVAAEAGLGGTVLHDGRTHGFGGAGATAGGKTVIKTLEPAPVVHHVQPIQSKKTVYVEKQITTQQVQPVHQTKTVLKYQEPETVYIRKAHRRPHHRKQVYYTAGVQAGANLGASHEVPQTVKVVEKTYTKPTVVVEKYIAPAPVEVHKYVSAPARGGFLTRLFATTDQTESGTGTSANGETVKTVSTTVAKNGNLFNDIFNIPIATLTAVNQLVNGIVGGTSVSVAKHVSTSASANGEIQKHY